MNPEKIRLVKQSFEKIVPLKDSFAANFYSEVFRLDPSLKPMFKTDMEIQKEKLVKTLVYVIASLDNPALIMNTVQELGRKHLDYGVKKEHYDTVGAAMISALKGFFGDEMQGDLLDAWVDAYGVIAGMMKSAAYKN
jgi:hemoglobin-like flavoprotein